MGLFDKKYCDICGNKIGLLGNKKLEDGNMCADCAKKLSHWFQGRRHTTLEMIKNQLAYREANLAAVEAFKPTRKLGTERNKFFLLNDQTGKFIVLREGEAMDKNPDLLDRAKVSNPVFHIEENTSEEHYKNAEGKMVSYVPPHYSYTYRFMISMDYDSEFYNEISFSLTDFAIDGGKDGEAYKGDFTDNRINRGSALGSLADAAKIDTMKFISHNDLNRLPGGYRPDGVTSMSRQNIVEYKNLETLGNEIIDFLLGDNATLNEWICSCGAHNSSKFCEYCGSPRPS